MSPTAEPETLKFQISTRRTGRLRTLQVAIFAEYAEFLDRYHWYGKAAGYVTDVPENYQIDGAFISRKDWDDRDPRPHQGIMLLSWPTITAAVIAHEATHAAMHIYSIDEYRDNSRASAHLRIENETVPYIVGDVFSAVCRRVLATGHSLQVGGGGSPTGHKS